MARKVSWIKPSDLSPSSKLAVYETLMNVLQRKSPEVSKLEMIDDLTFSLTASDVRDYYVSNPTQENAELVADYDMFKKKEEHTTYSFDPETLKIISVKHVTIY